MSARLAKIYRLVLVCCGGFAGLVFCAMAVLVSLDVVLRNLNIINFPWLLELSEYALYAATFLAAPWVLNMGSHVRVDLVVSALPRTAARICELLADLAGLAIVAIVGWYGLRVTQDAFARGDLVVKELVIPEWVLLAVMPLACLLMTIEFARRAILVVSDDSEPESQFDRPQGL